MNKNMKKINVVASLCLSMSLVACGPDNRGPNTAVAPNQNAQANANSSAQFNTNSQAEVALAAYHEVDASFSDAARVSSASSFRTQQLLDLDDGDASASGSVDASVDASTNTSASSDNTSTTANTDLSADVNADVNADASTDNGGLDASLGSDGDGGVDASLNTDTDGGVDANLSTGTNGGVDANLSTDGDGSLDASLNTDGGVDANLSAGSNGGIDANLNTGSDANTDASLRLGASVDSDMNSDVDGVFESFADTSNALESQLEASGGVDVDSSGNVSVDDDQIASNVNSTVAAQATTLASIDTNDVRSRINLTTDQMARLSSRNMSGTLNNLSVSTNADGSTQNNFNLDLSNGMTDRDITFFTRNSGDTELNSAFELTERGQGFDRNAIRASNLQADGTLKVMTRSTTMLGDGDKITIFEERITDVRGNGTGNGSITIETAEGDIERFDLRTMAKADGSLTTFLDGNMDNADLMIRENANGQANLSIVSNNRSELDRVSLDLNSMIQTTGRTDFDF